MVRMVILPSCSFIIKCSHFKVDEYRDPGEKYSLAKERLLEVSAVNEANT